MDKTNTFNLSDSNGTKEGIILVQLTNVENFLCLCALKHKTREIHPYYVNYIENLYYLSKSPKS